MIIHPVDIRIDRLKTFVFTPDDLIDLCHAVGQLVQVFPRDQQEIIAAVAYGPGKSRRPQKSAPLIDNDDGIFRFFKFRLPVRPVQSYERAGGGNGDAAGFAERGVFTDHVVKRRFAGAAVPRKHRDVPPEGKGVRIPAVSDADLPFTFHGAPPAGNGCRRPEIHACRVRPGSGGSGSGSETPQARNP